MAETKNIETFKQRPTSWTFNREPLLLATAVELEVADGLTVKWDRELVDDGVVVENSDTCRTFFVAKPTPVVTEPLDTSAKNCLNNTS